MNLLIFVMTLLMLMATITYSRLEHYLTAQIQASEWTFRVRSGARSLYNQDPLSCRIQPPKINPDPSLSGPKLPAQQKAPKGTGKLAEKYLLNPGYRQNRDKDFQKIQDIFKQLAKNLYKDQPFFKNLEKERPAFLDEMLNEIVDITTKAPKPIKSFNDLMYEKWSDPNIKRAFSLMLQSTVTYKKPRPETLLRGEAMDEAEVEKASPVGKVSLKDYFHDQNQDKVRLWLAKPELLSTFYQNQELVDALLKERKELYKKVVSDLIDPEEAKKEMEEHYGQGRSPYESFIDFTVTKTRPPQ